MKYQLCDVHLDVGPLKVIVDVVEVNFLSIENNSEEGGVGSRAV